MTGSLIRIWFTRFLNGELTRSLNQTKLMVGSYPVAETEDVSITKSGELKIKLKDCGWADFIIISFVSWRYKLQKGDLVSMEWQNSDVVVADESYFSK